jgi:hemerythrin superfamily protein
MVKGRLQVVETYLENLPLFKVAVMGEGLEKIHMENVRSATPWDALRHVIDKLGDTKLTQYGVLALDDEPTHKGVA